MRVPLARLTTRVAQREASWKPACWRAVRPRPGDASGPTPSHLSLSRAALSAGAMAGNWTYNLRNGSQVDSIDSANRNGNGKAA